jgi:hypothetical protein
MGRIIVTVQRTPGSASIYSTDVNYRTGNGTALAGIDYVGKSGTLSWNAGQLCAKSFSVPIASSGMGTTNKFFTIGLYTGPTQGPTGILQNNNKSAEIFVSYNGSEHNWPDISS